jgi:hypothetical protein
MITKHNNSARYVASGRGAKQHMSKRRKIKKNPSEGEHWSQHVNETSNALDLEAGVFLLTDPGEIAQSLKKSADNSRRRKSDPFRSAMSMLTFYINRAGRNLQAEQRKCLEEAKDELRELYGRKRQNPRHTKR